MTPTPALCTMIVDKLPLPPLWQHADPAAGRANADRAAAEIVTVMYGELPPPPDTLYFEPISQSLLQVWPGAPQNWIYRVHCGTAGRQLSFTLRLLFPDGEGPFPVVLTGDGCWNYATDEVKQSFLEKGGAFAEFNRTEFARDLGGKSQAADGWNLREGGLYGLCPGGRFGAVAA